MKKTKITIPKTKFFVDVRLYNNTEQLKKATKCNDCVAMYRPDYVVIYPKRKVSPKLGTIYLSKERLGCGLISHEVFHCSMDYAEKKFNIKSVRTENNKRQEDIAYMHGHCVREIINWLKFFLKN